MPNVRNDGVTPIEFFTSYQIAELFKVSPPTARSWMKSGKIADSFTIPNSNERRAPATAVLAFAEKQKLPISDFLRSCAEYQRDKQELGTGGK